MNQRTIKFRAWDKQCLLYRDWKFFQKLTVAATFNPQNFILEQFTNLLDKNGEEIYEGDIVMLDGSMHPKKIDFQDGAFVCGTIYGGADAYRMEVIGNIHENPQLLKAD